MGDPRKIAKANTATTSESKTDWDRLSLTNTPLASELAHDMELLSRVQAHPVPRPAQTRIVAVANQKGGVGKTTTAVNLAAALAESGLRVLVVDSDPQGNATTALGIERVEGMPSLYDVFLGRKTMMSTLRQNDKYASLLVVPSSIDLAAVDVDLADADDRRTRLKVAVDSLLLELEELDRHIDYVFIDCPPSMSLLPINALIAAKEVLIPVQCEYYALEGLTQLLRTIDSAKQAANPSLEVSTIVLTMASKNTNLSAEVAENVREYFPQQTLDTVIPRSVRIAESPSYGETVISYAPRSSGAIAYLAAANELANRGR